MTSVPRLLLDEHPLIILPSLACQFGLNEAIVLQQLHYWLLKNEHVFEGVSWVYNSYPQWRQQFPFWSERTIRRVLTNLEHDGIVVAGNFNTLKQDQTKWYTISYDKVQSVATWGGQVGHPTSPSWPPPRASSLSESSEFQPEITTEIEDTPKPPQKVARTRQKKSSGLRTNYTPGFLSWWDAYPADRRQDKPMCFAVWEEHNLEYRTEVLVEKLERLKETNWKHCERKYIITSLPYLNAGRFEDDLVPLPAMPAQEDTGLGDKGFKTALGIAQLVQQRRKNDGEYHRELRSLPRGVGQIE